MFPRNRSTPPAKGRMLSVFLQPQIGRCKAKKTCWPWPLVFWPRGQFEFESFGLWIPKLSNSNRPRGLKGGYASHSPSRAHRSPQLAAGCVRFATKLVVVAVAIWSGVGIKKVVYVYVRVCICMCVCVYVCACGCVCGCVCVEQRLAGPYPFRCVCACVRVWVCVYFL